MLDVGMFMKIFIKMNMNKNKNTITRMTTTTRRDNRHMLRVEALA